MHLTIKILPPTESDYLPRIPLTISFLLIIIAIGTAGSAQQMPLPDAPQPQTQPEAQPQPQNVPPALGPERKKHQLSKNHIFWVIPNYREEENSGDFKPLTPKAKLKIAFDDSFDPSAFLVAGVFAGMSMAQKQYAFGQGAQGFAKYYGGAFADQAIGNMMTEALFPIALHQDPRYFNKGHGGFLRRTGYAMSREVITRGDDGENHFNTSELLGNAVAAGISNAYYPAVNRSATNTANKWGQQIALDTAFNVMKEFWPDVRRKFFGQ